VALKVKQEFAAKEAKKTIKPKRTSKAKRAA
jgi:hypothetical protein